MVVFQRVSCVEMGLVQIKVSTVKLAIAAVLVLSRAVEEQASVLVAKQLHARVLQVLLAARTAEV